MLMRYAGCLHVEAEVDQFGDLSLVRSMDIEKHIVPGFRTSAHYLYGAQSETDSLRPCSTMRKYDVDCNTWCFT